MECEKCHTIHDGSYGSGRFCSEKCSMSFATRDKRKDINKKVSAKLKKNDDVFCSVCDKKISYRAIKTHMCQSCFNDIRHLTTKSKYDVLKDHRQRMKTKAIEYKGGKCVICGYDKCQRSMDFHHEGDKEFGISKNMNKSWSKIKDELDKCILLCKNCHGELHELIKNKNNKHSKEEQVTLMQYVDQK